MIPTSNLYKSILSSQTYSFEVALVIGESGKLITERAETILFAGTAILVATGAADTGYREEMLYTIDTSGGLFSGQQPTVGGCIAGEIHIVMRKPTSEIPRRAMLRPYIRATNGTDVSEWIPQGTYFVDTKEYSRNSDGNDTLTIHGYDAMVLFDKNYPSDSQHTYPLLDTTMVSFIANSEGINVDSRTWNIMTDGYRFSLPVGYSSREVLQMIASAYAGSFIITPLGELRLVQINEMPAETRLLTDQIGYTLVFGSGVGEVRILV